jgi:hypothetical protein
MEEEASVRNLGRLKSMIRSADGQAGMVLLPGTGGNQSPCPKFVPRMAAPQDVNGEKRLR